MVEHDYPLQALLYSVALHRYLRWRLPGYRPGRPSRRRGVPVRPGHDRARRRGERRPTPRGVRVGGPTGAGGRPERSARRSGRDGARVMSPWPRWTGGSRWCRTRWPSWRRSSRPACSASFEVQLAAAMVRLQPDVGDGSSWPWPSRPGRPASGTSVPTCPGWRNRSSRRTSRPGPRATSRGPGWRHGCGRSSGRHLVQDPGALPLDRVRPLVWDGDRLYLQRYWYDERAVAADLTRRARAGPPEVGDGYGRRRPRGRPRRPVRSGRRPVHPTCSGLRSAGR